MDVGKILNNQDCYHFERYKMSKELFKFPKTIFTPQQTQVPHSISISQHVLTCLLNTSSNKKSLNFKMVHNVDIAQQLAVMNIGVQHTSNFTSNIWHPPDATLK